MTTKSYAKVNIYLKIVGTQGDYHLIDSRFMIVENLYDTITFKKERSDLSKDLEIVGKFSCTTEQNIIYKAYRKLLQIDEISKKIKDFFKEHSILVDKKIPEFAGLGGGSSNAASFLLLANQELSLKLSKNRLLEISKSLGADVPFFINGYKSAHVEGIGEIVKEFKENNLNISTITPPIKCDTPLVYKKFRETLNKNYDKIIQESKKLSKKLNTLKSEEILHNFEPEILNDLFMPAIKLYPELLKYKKEGYFFSGSGSSFFKRIA